MLIETLALWLVLCAALAILSWVSRSFAMSIVAAFGLMIIGLQYYADESDLFVLGMLLMLAFAVPMAVAGRDRRK